MKLNQSQLSELKQRISKLNHDYFNELQVLMLAETGIDKTFLTSVLISLGRLRESLDDVVD